MKQDELNEYMAYDPITGIVTWKKFTSSRAKVGEEVGYVSTDGYRYFGFKGKVLKTHRAIYLMVHGVLPKYVDHKDHDHLNNKIDNLRAATATCNARNQSLQQNNQSGVVGVSWSKSRKKWYAVIWQNSKPIPLGRYSLLEDAVKVRKEAEVKYGYHTNHGK